MDGEAWWATYSPRGCKELDTTERLHFTSEVKSSYFHFYYSSYNLASSYFLGYSVIENVKHVKYKTTHDDMV